MEIDKNEELRKLVHALTIDSKGVTWRKMFGCHAVFVDGAIFGLVWKTGRIAVKLDDVNVFNELFSIPGSDPWMAGKKTMSNWILVPESFISKRRILRYWINKAYTIAHQSNNKLRFIRI